MLLSTASAGAQPHLKVATFNAWGIPELKVPWVGWTFFRPGGVQHTDLRLSLLCRELRRIASDPKEQWDVVFLQEVWHESDQQKLTRCGFPHHVIFKKRSKSILKIGNGLLILSRHPILQTDRHAFHKNGRGFNLFRVFKEGESLAEKSVIAAKISHPEIGGFWVGNMHLVARYSLRRLLDGYRKLRLKQFARASEWLRDIVGNDPAIIGGDFNFGPKLPGSERYDEAFERIPVDYLPGYRTGSMKGDPKTIFTITRANPFQKAEGRFDHIFVSSHFEIVSDSLIWNEPLATSKGKIHLSDHYGYLLEARFAPSQPPMPSAAVQFETADLHVD